MKQISGVQETLGWIENQDSAMRRMLTSWAEVNSGSDHPAGLARMGKILEQAFSELGGECRWIKAQSIETVDMRGEIEKFVPGDILSIKKRPTAPFKILLCGHMDTVFSAEHAFQTVRKINDNCLSGPGVTDMKGGLLVMLYALLAFEKSPLADKLGWEVVINADEELGSPGSAFYLSQIAQQYRLALVYEPAMDPEGSLAGERKGSGKFTLVAKGRSAHAGRAFHDGRNAICILAECISEIHQLNSLRDGLTVNVGKIAGGEALNVVPDCAVAKLDVRITSDEDKTWFMERVNAILRSYGQREGFSLALNGGFGRAPKPMTPDTLALFEQLKSIARTLGLELSWKPSGGCCDGNNLAAEGLAVIDTLGVRGGKIHSSEEYILLDSLVERTQLSALLLMQLAENC